MPLVAAKCTQCGANIEVDDTKEAGICKYCGTAFVTEKVIEQYAITNNISNSIVNIYQSSDKDVFETDGHRLLAYKGEESIVTIPEHITVIGQFAFGRNNAIEEIILPASVTEIENQAFVSCTHLKKVHIPDSVFAIGAMAFGECKDLVTVNLPQRLRVIEANLFFGCNSLREVSLKNNIFKIKSECFAECTSLKKITIPASVTEIEGFPFYGCNLDTIVFENADNITTITNSLFYKSTKVPEIVASEKFKNEFGKYLSTQEQEVHQKGSCYIATCVYGSYDCPQVWTLRRFRDYTLDESWYGRLFIKYYYAISPTLVKWFGGTKWFRQFWKNKLDKLVSYLNNKGVEDAYYQDKY